jgi:Caenorhabditis protein of unknown function, DUF268
VTAQSAGVRAGRLPSDPWTRRFYRLLILAGMEPLRIGSRIDGFVAHVALFREIEVLDIRPMREQIPNIVFRQVDFMREDQPLADYCDSVSCLHALEHFGLGRYGDPVDRDGHLRGFRNLRRILQGRHVLSLGADGAAADRVRLRARVLARLPVADGV